MFKKKENPVKVLKNHFSKRFAAAIEQFQSQILTAEDIQLLIENEPTVAFVVEQIRREQLEAAKQEANKRILDRQENLIESLFSTAQKERLILEDELARLMLTVPGSPDEVKAKQSKLNLLADRIKAADVILCDLENCRAKNFKVSRGRPRKVEERSIFDIANEVEEVDSSGQNLNERIATLVKQLTLGDKKYLLVYIEKMLEVGNANETKIT